MQRAFDLLRRGPWEHHDGQRLTLRGYSITRKSVPSWLPTSCSVADMRMIQRRNSASFTLEALAGVRI